MINDDIRFTKGSYDVTVFTAKVTESVKNALKIVAGKGGQSRDNQSDGPKDTMIVDMLKITNAYHVEAYITKTDSKTAKQVKDELKKIAEGADIDGGDVTMYYEDGTVDGYIETLNIDKVYNDNSVETYTGIDSAEYHVTIEFIKGKGI